MSTVQKNKIAKIFKVLTFNSKIPVEASLFTKNKLDQVDSHNQLYPLV